MTVTPSSTKPALPKIIPVEDDPYVITGARIKDPPENFFGILRHLGPGFILSAAVVGSGELIATTSLGAKAGRICWKTPPTVPSGLRQSDSIIFRARFLCRRQIDRSSRRQCPAREAAFQRRNPQSCNRNGRPSGQRRACPVGRPGGFNSRGRQSPRSQG